MPRTRTTKTEATPKSEVKSIPLTWIKAGDNDRKEFRPESLENLAASIKAHGLIQPITVRIAGPKKYEIIAGERRFRAAQLAGLKSIDGIIRNLDDEDAAAVMLAENTGRVNLNPIEEANAYKKRLESGWSIQKLSEAAGVSKEIITRRQALLNLMDVIQASVARYQMPLGHAEIMEFLDAERQQIAFRIFLHSHKAVSFPIFKEIVERLQSEQDQMKLFDLEEFFLTAVDDSLTLSGKKALVKVPIRSDLPEIESSATDSTGSIIERYVRKLQATGFDNEAGAIGTLYSELVAKNFVRIPQMPGL